MTVELIVTFAMGASAGAIVVSGLALMALKDANAKLAEANDILDRAIHRSQRTMEFFEKMSR